ncbi:hypothetical protein HRI_001297400 [Hibiscus trionum]|uniref:Rapid ALkalinization Factor n=1 Tax=Hibiscus trionum TaxID=183268 RepID=A0A9W7LUI4_HIBTR|nr:hypothetical protein HRI_001297400 [Hibiscus trionum]
MKQKCLSLAILVLLFYNSMNPSGAVSTETNGTASIIADDNELEFLMDSHFGRILQSGGNVGYNSGNSGRAVANCGRGGPYDSCVPNPNRPATPQNCGTYTRSCGR